MLCHVVAVAVTARSLKYAKIILQESKIQKGNKKNITANQRNIDL